MRGRVTGRGSFQSNDWRTFPGCQSSLAQNTQQVSRRVNASHQAHWGVSQQWAKSGDCSSERTNKSTWDCKHCSMAALEAKQGEAKPLPLVGLPTRKSKPSLLSQNNDRALLDTKTDQRQPELPEVSSPQAFSSSQGIIFLFCWGRMGWIYGNTQMNDKKLTPVETQTV